MKKPYTKPFLKGEGTKPKIMGILNITPDSFYDGGEYFELEKAKEQITKMIIEGVDIIDVGAFSSRPGSIMPSIEEELSRLLPILDYLDTLNISYSVDSCRSEVIQKLTNYNNLKYINDISGLSDEKILDIIKSRDIGYVLMHIKGIPENMQDNPIYNDIISEMLSFFEEKIEILKKKGIKNIIIDPGFGFGKSLEDNYKILNNLEKFKKFSIPLLVGLSRKSMIYKLLETSPENVLSETVALNLFALQKGADIIRVHDIKEHKNIIKIFQKIND